MRAAIGNQGIAVEDASYVKDTLSDNRPEYSGLKVLGIQWKLMTVLTWDMYVMRLGRLNSPSET